MESKTFKNWWLLAINGVLAIFVGILLLFCTADFIKTVVMYIGLIILLCGIFLLGLAIYYLKKDRKVATMMIESIISITIGIIIMIFPEGSLNWFLILLGVWAVIVGIFQLVILVNIGKYVANKNVILFNGLLTIALGVFLMLYPVTFASAVAKILGIAAVVFGVMMIYLGFSIRKLKPPAEKASAPPAEPGK